MSAECVCEFACVCVWVYEYVKVGEKKKKM